MSTTRRYRTPATLLAAMVMGAAFLATMPARGQAVAFGPVIGQFNDGVMMGVTPAASADRRHVRIGGGAMFTGLQGMDVVNVPGAVAGGGVGGGFRQMAPGGANGAGNVAGNNGFIAGGVATPSAATFVEDSAVQNGWYGVGRVRPYYYGWAYPPVAGPLLYNAPFGGFGPAPGYGTVNTLMPMSNAIRYGVGYRR